MYSRLFLTFLALYFFYIFHCSALEECDTLRARCAICERNLNSGPNEDNLAAAVNRKCQMRVGHQYVWKTLGNCEIFYYACEAPQWNCSTIAQMANMQRRLP